MMVRDPSKPSARKVSAALRPASEAPTITMLPWALNSANTSSLRIRPLRAPAARRLGPGNPDGLDGARRRRGPHPLALRRVRGGVVPERFLAVQRENLRSEETALGVRLTPIEIDDNLDGICLFGTFRRRRGFSGHLLFLSAKVQDVLF